MGLENLTNYREKLLLLFCGFGLFPKRKTYSMLIVFSLGLISFLINRAYGNQDAASDSVRNEQRGTFHSSESVLYEIYFTRLQRIVSQALQKKPNWEMPADIVELVSEAKLFAEEGDYDLAIELLEEVITYFDSEEYSPKNSVGSNTHNSPDETVQSSSDWTKYVFIGSDFWQQKFNLALGEQDSTILEGEGNPFIGLRLRMDYAKGALVQTQAEIEAKSSRDYLSGRLLLDHRHQISRSVHTKFENRFDITSYRRDSNLRYFDDKLDIGLFYSINNSHSFEIINEIQIREYAHQSDLYTSFFQNRTRTTLSVVPFGMTRVDIDYDYRSRKHNFDPGKDYDEHRLGTDAWYGLASNISTLLMAQWRTRRYIQPGLDTLLAKDFSQFYSEADLRIHLSKGFSFYLGGNFEIRNYRDPSTVIPSYWELIVEPSLTINLGAPCTLRFGYNFKERQHSAFSDRSSKQVEIEDFYSHGPALTIDIFTLGGLVFSLTDIYEFRRYPNSISKGISDFSLYSDRNVNSLFMFLSWNFSQHWELDVIANLDQDTDIKDENGDSRTTLCTLELSYRF